MFIILKFNFYHFMEYVHEFCTSCFRFCPCWGPSTNKNHWLSSTFTKQESVAIQWVLMGTSLSSYD